MYQSSLAWSVTHRYATGVPRARKERRPPHDSCLLGDIPTDESDRCHCEPAVHKWLKALGDLAGTIYSRFPRTIRVAVSNRCP